MLLDGVSELVGMLVSAKQVTGNALSERLSSKACRDRTVNTVK